MLAIPFIIIYLAVNFFVGMDLYLWIKSFKNPFRYKKAKVIFIAVFSILTSLIIVAFALPDSDAKKTISRVTNYYLGFMINLLIVLALAHTLALILKKTKVVSKEYFRSGKPKFIAGWVCFVLSVGFSVYGFVNANNIEVASYDVTVNKKGDDMKIVLVADTHLGYSLGVRNMRDMAEKINVLEPDLVCFAGDVFDNNFNSLDDPSGIKQAFQSIESTYGKYACWGNHDVIDKLIGGFSVSFEENQKIDSRMKTFLEKSGITVLEDDALLIDDKFTLVGRLDMSKPGTDDAERLDIDEIEFDSTLPVICMDHEPDELSEKAEAGVDIDLGGHTHNGQFFPLNLGIGFVWENPKGHIEKKTDDGHIMHSIVTEGVGVYGPFMRTFTNSEIVEINVTFRQ
ncbi:MAG: metallophosphoesterase [Oscillospiraceae bacterium]|nr:metallophosphoesterase [Oscillospiraceae bacterium]